MGGVIESVFGGSHNSSSSQQTSDSSSQSASGNHAYDYLMQQLNPQVGTGGAAMGQIGALLGVGGDKNAANAGYSNFMNSSGYQNIFDQAMKGVTGSAAAKGTLNSGATLKALQNTGAGLAQQSFGNYLGNLQGLVNSGQSAAGLIGNAGQYSNSSSTSHSTGTSNASGKSSNGIFNSIFG
jgi:hypothetical protein